MIEKIIVHIVLFCFAPPIFSQIYNKSININENSTKQQLLDDSVDYYEKAAIKFYHIQKYDSALAKFKSAGFFLDSLSKERNKLSDYVNTLVTKCNIALCICKKGKFYLALKDLPWPGSLDSKKIVGLAENKSSAYYISSKILVFLQFTEGDCKKEMGRPKEALGWYAIAYDNLSTDNFRDLSLITYEYALKSYLYKWSYKELLHSYRLGQDTLNADIYVDKISDLSKDK